MSKAMMRHNIFLKTQLFFICFLTVSFGYAQKFSVGIKGGAHGSWTHFSDKEDRPLFDTKTGYGFTGGILISFPLKNNFAFYAEAAYSTKKRRVLWAEGTWENRNTYDFIDLNMLLRKSFIWHLRKDLPMKWFVNIGPEVSYWLSAKGKIVTEIDTPYDIIFNQPTDYSYQRLYYNDINRWLFSLSAGVGFEAPLRNNKRLLFELRFISGHTNFGKKVNPTLVNDRMVNQNAYIEILDFQDFSLRQNLKTLQFTTAYILDLDVKESRKGKSTLKKKMKKNR